MEVLTLCLNEALQILSQEDMSEEQCHKLIFAKNGVLDRCRSSVHSRPKQEWGEFFKELETINQQIRIRFAEKFPKIEKSSIDTTIPVFDRTGRLHPLKNEYERILRIMHSYGFAEAKGPIITDEYNNFDVLNVGKMHPSRDMQDTFYIKSGCLLRTHTSSVDYDNLCRFKKSGADSVKMFYAGRVYRRDEDSTHSTMFWQMEAVYLDRVEKVNFSHLKWFLRNFAEKVFEQNDIRMQIRSSYFPFTDMSVEADIMCVKTPDGFRVLREGEEHKDAQWMEVLGAGMLCQNILHKAGYTQHAAMATGIGIDRIVMLRQQVSNINDFYKNRMSFLGGVK